MCQIGVRRVRQIERVTPGAASSEKLAIGAKRPRQPAGEDGVKFTVAAEQDQELITCQRSLRDEDLVTGAPPPVAMEPPSELIAPEVGHAGEGLLGAAGDVEPDVPALLDGVCPVLDARRLAE